MLSYFGLIAAASLLITLEFIYAIQSAMPHAQAAAEGVEAAGHGFTAVATALQGLRNKAMLMFAVQAGVTLIVLIMFMRRITGPLQHMVEVSQAISEGDLSRTINVRSRDEIGALGETINGLTSNIQEIVAYGMTTQASLNDSLERLRAETTDCPDAAREIDDIETTLSGFDDIMQSFTLFPAPMESETEDGRS